MTFTGPLRVLGSWFRVTGPVLFLSLFLPVGTSAGEAVKVRADLLPVAEIRPGMIGVGRTVFQGHVPEEFEVEILGVLENALAPRQDLIVSRLRGANVERTGVISGMSGSPVTIGGKLIGAISYRLGVFEKEAIAGITPIADMLRVADFPTAAADLSAGSLLESWVEVDTAESDLGRASVPAQGAEEFRQIATPLVYGGFPKDVIQRATPLFRSLGLQPLQGGGGGEGIEEYPIRPGVPVALELVRGDLSLSSVGTVTHVEGNQLWAFGHPFLGAGPVLLPMARTEVIVVYPSQLSSFMIATPTSPLGTLLQDRLTAVQGVVGPVPEMIPVEVTLDSQPDRRTFSYEICQSPHLTPVLLALTLQASLQQVLEYSTGSTYRARLNIETENQPPVHYDLVEAGLGRGPGGEVVAMAGEAAGIFNALFSNRFEPPRIRSVRLEVARIPGDRVARIQALSVRPARVRAGEKITVQVTLQPYRGRPVLREIQVEVPPETLSGPLGVVVASARGLAVRQRNLLQLSFNGLADLSGLIEFLNGLRSEDTLYLQLTRPQSNAIVGGKPLPALPLSVLFTLASDRFAGEEYPAFNLPLVERRIRTDFVLVGARSSRVQVR